MTHEVQIGPLYAAVRDCWVLDADRRTSYPRQDMATGPATHALAIESVHVDEPHRRQGHLTRFLEMATADPRFDLVTVEGVQNPVLAEALIRWGWEWDPGVMDFYRRRPGA
jgi:GNAT superfamily N-acetyltransferase